MANEKASSLGISGLEARLKKAFEILGAFPVELLQHIHPTVHLFNCDAPGLHTWQGKVFAGSHSIIAGGGNSKLALQAPYELVVEDHWITNLAGASASMTLRMLGPTDGSMGGTLSLRSFWMENVDGLAQDQNAGITTIEVNAGGALTQPAIWTGVIPALSTVYVRHPVHLLPGGRLALQDEVAAAAIAYAWRGYVLS